MNNSNEITITDMANQGEESDINIIFNYESLSNSELIQKFSQLQQHSINVDETNKQLQKLVKDLELALQDQKEKCQTLEEDRTALRKNIHKASANWFERKAKLSECDNEQTSSESNNIEKDNEQLSECDNGQTSSESSNLEKDNELEKIFNQSLLSKEEAIQVFSDLKFKSDQLDLTEKRISELSKRLKDYENVIDDQEIIIHGMQNQLDTYFDDNQKMSKQLNEIYRFFQELEISNEKKEENAPTKAETPPPSNQDLPSTEEFKSMSKSVSKTFIKLKELIYEKKSLVTEIERLRVLNVELQNRVSQQENRLMSVSDALQTTWLLVSNLKDSHEKIHTNESILRYQLREKREILQKLREELECSREQWHTIRQMNTQTEQEWTTLRRELNERRRAENLKKLVQDDEPQTQQKSSAEAEFEPPIDLLLDMGIECGAVDADDEVPVTCVALMGGEDVQAERLQTLEDQCCHLYQKLMTSTSRALSLASRLTTLHEQYNTTDDEEDDDLDDLDSLNDEDDNLNIFESIISPDSESYDTAYVSEPDINDPTSTNEATALSSEATPETSSYPDTGVEEGASPYDSSPEFNEEACDVLSKRLINFLPKKIELLRADNKKLEEKYQNLMEEKLKSEAIMSASIEFESRQRKKLEEQLAHIGKYVDELKLERNGKIAKIEETLKKKMEEVEQQEKRHIQMEEEFESLKEKHDERGNLLQLTALQLQQTEERAQTAEEALNKFKHELDFLHQEIDKLKVKNNEVKETRLGDIFKRSSTLEKESTEKKEGYVSKIQVSNPGASSGVKAIVKELERRSANRSSETYSRYTAFNELTFPTCIILAKNTEYRLPFQLNVGSTLNWEFQVSPKGIRFFICYDQWRLESDSDRNDCHSSEEVERVSDLKLINPVNVGASESVTKGRITPRLPGQFSLVFCNPLIKTQEVRVKLWITSDIDSGK